MDNELDTAEILAGPRGGVFLALETVAVIAYRQPVTRAEIEAARGVDSDHSLRRLLARGLVEEVGRRERKGRATEKGWAR